MNTLGIKLAWFWMAAFIFSGVVGFIPNPIVGTDAFFVTNAAHNLVHIVTAVGFIIVASMGNTASIKFMLGFGVVYVLVGVIGFFVTMGSGEGMLLGFIHINSLDNFLHLSLGAGIFISGIIANKATSLMPRNMAKKVA
jgi:hypothetical protein